MQHLRIDRCKFLKPKPKEDRHEHRHHESVLGILTLIPSSDQIRRLSTIYEHGALFQLDANFVFVGRYSSVRGSDQVVAHCH